MKLNQAAVKHAKKLIADNHYIVDSDWSEAQSSTIHENKYLDEHTWDEYALWYLGLDTKEDKDTKGHYAFPYGDLENLHRSGLIAVKQRAAQYDYGAIEKAADELLQLIDEREGQKA